MMSTSTNPSGSYDLERHRQDTVDNSLIIVSADDSFEVGEGTTLGNDFSKYDHIYIFAEHLNIKGHLKLRQANSTSIDGTEGGSATISTTYLTVKNGAVLDASGENASRILPLGDGHQNDGGNGGSGGSLSLYVHAVNWASPPDITVMANGGRGTNGRGIDMSLMGAFDQAKQLIKDFSEGKNIPSRGHSNVFGIDLYWATEDRRNRLRQIIREISSDSHLDSCRSCLEGYTSSSLMILAFVGGCAKEATQAQREYVANTGGNGGDAGDGGQVFIFLNSPLQELQKLLKQYPRYLPKKLSFDQKKRHLVQIINKTLGSLAYHGLKDGLDQLSDASNGNTLRAAVRTLSKKVARDRSEYLRQLRGDKIRVNRREPGSSGYVEGFRGRYGRKGQARVTTFDRAGVDLTKHQGFLAHPAQCARLLELAKVLYWQLNPMGGSYQAADTQRLAQKTEEVKNLLLSIQRKTQPFVDARIDPAGEKSAPLVNFYQENEAKIGVVGAVERLRSLHADASVYLRQLAQGHDLFGYSSTYVPIISFDSYLNFIDELLEAFEAFEQDYQSYFADRDRINQQKDRIRKARDQQDEIISNAAKEEKDLMVKAAATANRVLEYRSLLTDLRQDVVRRIRAVQNKLRDHVEFGGVDLIATLESMSSISLAAGFDFAIVSGAYDLRNTYKDATSTIRDDDGNAVSTDLLVRKLDAITVDIEAGVQAGLERVNEGYEVLQDGKVSLNDPGAELLIAEEQQMNEFLGDFYDSFPAELDDLRTAFRNYLTQVIARNNQILEYNQLIGTILKQRQLSRVAQERKQALADEALELRAKAPLDIDDFMFGTYQRMRSQVMETLSLTSRAYRFWALDSDNLIANTYWNTPLSDINASTLRALRVDIIDKCQSVIEKYAPRQEFNIVDDNAYIIDQKNHADLLKSFKQTGMLKLVLPPATRQTKNIDENIFFDKANVRLNSMRVWIDGARTQDNDPLQVTIIHHGQEKIVDTNGQVFSFSHRAIERTFIYDLKNRDRFVRRQRRSKGSFYENPEEYKDTAIVRSQANFTDVVKDNSLSSSSHAAIGPFTSWTIYVDPNAHSGGVRLNRVQRIAIEFKVSYLPLIN